jgi:lipoprotein-anchoring transpeptidase ErfK/SrfK
MEEWPEWVPSHKCSNAYPSRVAGGPGTPVGARVLYLDNDSMEIHGTNAPKTVGQATSLGCFRMANNDDVWTDLIWTSSALSASSHSTRADPATIPA